MCLIIVSPSNPAPTATHPPRKRTWRYPRLGVLGPFSILSMNLAPRNEHVLVLQRPRFKSPSPGIIIVVTFAADRLARHHEPVPVPNPLACVERPTVSNSQSSLALAGKGLFILRLINPGRQMSIFPVQLQLNHTFLSSSVLSLQALQPP